MKSNTGAPKEKIDSQTQVVIGVLIIGFIVALLFYYV